MGDLCRIHCVALPPEDTAAILRRRIKAAYTYLVLPSYLKQRGLANDEFVTATAVASEEFVASLPAALSIFSMTISATCFCRRRKHV